MTYIDKNLLPDEQIIYRTKKHFIIFLEPLFWTIAVFFLLNYPLPIANTIGLLLIFVAFTYWAYYLLDYFTSDFAVTTKRIIMKEGFFFRHVNETRLSTIANVSVDQSLLGRILDYGSVVIHPFGGGTDPFLSIDSPNTFKNHLQAELFKISK